jgi:hypothetical protein
MNESALPVGDSELVEARITEQEGTFHVHATRIRPPVVVSVDGDGVVSHAGSRLLADLADQTMLTG